MDINFIDPTTILDKVYRDYDIVVICGFTTAILEAINSGVPILIFSRQKLSLDLIDQSKIPVFSDSKQLIKFIKEGSYDNYYEYINRLRNSIKNFSLTDLSFD